MAHRHRQGHRRIGPVRLVAAIASLCLLTVTACGDDGEAGGEGGLKPMHMVLAVPTPATDYAPYVIAKALGYWKEEGLDVKITPIAQQDGIQLLMSGGADVGVPSTWAGIFIPRSKGEKLISFYDLVPGFFQFVGVPEGSDIKSWQDLRGKRIGVVSIGSSNDGRVKAIARYEGLDPDKDLKFVPVGVGAQAAEALFNRHEVDALGLWTGQYAIMENLKPEWKFRTLQSKLETEIGFQIGLTAKEERIKADPDAFIGFARGVAKATIFAKENPEAAVQLHWQMFPEVKEKAASEQEAVAKGVKVMQTRLVSMDITKVKPQRDKWGQHETTEVQSLYDYFVKPGGDMGPEAVPIDSVFTNEYIDKINDFDVDAVREQARNWKPAS